MPQLTWVVANADRRLPLLDHDIDLVLSLHGRRNPTECARVLKPSGFLLIAIPASDDLVELRSLIQGEPLARDRTSGLLSAHQPYFTMVERSSVRDRRRFQREALLDLLRITYRGERRSMAGGVAGLDELDVTMASEIFLFTSR
jgi:SAM-dependent methyltransferase